MELFGERKIKLYLGHESRFYGLKENKSESRHIFKGILISNCDINEKFDIHVYMHQNMLVSKFLQNLQFTKGTLPFI